MYFLNPNPEKLQSALEPWAWLPLAGKVPILVTAFADVFFESSDGVCFLDTLEGKLQKVCDSRAALNRLLDSAEAKDLYLFSGFVDRAAREGNPLKDGQCYDWKRPPVLGGPIDFSNVEKTDFVVALNLRGQIHDQIRHVKPGTKISKIVVSSPKPSPP